MQNYNIIKDKDGRELTPHGDVGFPCAVYDEKFSLFTHGEVPWHWHEEIEIIYVISGSTKVFYLGGEQVLTPDMGIFINCNQPHRLTWESREECHIINFVFKPELIGGRSDSTIYRELISPVCKNSALPVVTFNPEIEWQKLAVDSLKQSFTSYNSKNPGYTIEMVQSLLEFWRLLYINDAHLVTGDVTSSADDRRIRNILKYIDEYYSEPISVYDLAKVGDISSSECFRLFKRSLKNSPVEYIIEYRLRKASNLLINSPDSILEIAMNSGFNSQAYFTKRFKQYYGVTPMQFRRNSN